MSSTGNEVRGFVVSRLLDGGTTGRTKLYATGSNARMIMKGDPVYLDANNKIQVFTIQASAGFQPLLGVVGACYDSNKKPLTHQLPNGGPVIGVSAAGYVAVHDNPDIVFVVQANTSAGGSHIGQFATVSAGAGVTAAGKSGFELDLANAVTTAVGHPFQVIGLAPHELDGLGGTSNKVEVRISNHLWRRLSDRTPFLGSA